MNFNSMKLIIILLVFFSMISCIQNNSNKKMKWLISNTIYEGLPLYLRLPDYENVWSFKNKFSTLFCITHKLDKIQDNGLPESDYNLSLMNFDKELVELFDNNKEGIIILIETFGGERNYWYYISSKVNFKDKIVVINKKYPTYKIETIFRDDSEWGFINKYPVKLYEEK